MHHALCANAACISCYAINTIHSELTFFFYLSHQHTASRNSKGRAREREAFRFVMERALTSVFVYARNYPLCTLLSHLRLLHDEAQSGCSVSVCMLYGFVLDHTMEKKQSMRISLVSELQNTEDMLITGSSKIVAYNLHAKRNSTFSISISMSFQ
jgi:hypothetical protein